MIKFENNTEGRARLWDTALKFLSPVPRITSPDHLACRFLKSYELTPCINPAMIFQVQNDSYLFSFQNPTDDENQQLKAAEGLFYQEDVFEMVMYVGLGVALAFFVTGLTWEFLCRRPKISEYCKHRVCYVDFSAKLSPKCFKQIKKRLSATASTPSNPRLSVKPD